MPEPLVALPELIACYKSDPHMTHQKWVQWACDCAERALPLFEAKYPDHTRPREAVAAARRWVSDPTPENREQANTADAAARAANAAANAANAADAAAYAAASAAARAANAAERQWQAFRLMEIYHG